MSITAEAITTAMHACTECYVQEIAASIEYELGRELTSQEHQALFQRVDEAIGRITAQMKGGAA